MVVTFANPLERAIRLGKVRDGPHARFEFAFYALAGTKLVLDYTGGSNWPRLARV